MNNKHQVHNLIILDESGSMDSIQEMIMQGFNEIVQTIKGIEKQFPEQEHFISMVSFNGLGQKMIHFIDPVSKLEFIDDTKYKPDASTPLYDAMGFACNKLRQITEEVKDCNVLVTILTDGEENASKEYTGITIKKMVEELKLNRWTFTYIGADHDVEEFAGSIGISNFIKFEKNKSAISKLFNTERHSRIFYSEKIRNNENTSDDFYKTEDPSTGNIQEQKE